MFDLKEAVPFHEWVNERAHLKSVLSILANKCDRSLTRMHVINKQSREGVVDYRIVGEIDNPKIFHIREI